MTNNWWRADAYLVGDKRHVAVFTQEYQQLIVWRDYKLIKISFLSTYKEGKHQCTDTRHHNSIHTSDTRNVSDFTSHHVIHKEALSLTSHHHLSAILSEVCCGDWESLQVHTLEWSVHLSINLRGTHNYGIVDTVNINL